MVFVVIATYLHHAAVCCASYFEFSTSLSASVLAL